MPSRRNLHWSSLAILSTGLLPVDPAGVLAQTTTAVCLDSFNWMQNSKSQSPCLLSAYLEGACNGGQFTVAALPPNVHYTGPYAVEQNPCQCSTVTYNAVSACGLCQGSTIVSWSTWSTNCSSVYLAFLPGIPGGTAIPQWAFQDVTTSNSFNITLAQSVGDNPESTAASAPSTLSSLPSSTSASVSSPPTSNPSGSKSHTGAIAGGVVGGVAGVALIIGVIVFFVMKQKRSRTLPSPQYATGAYMEPGSANYPDTAPFASQMTQPRLYDPSDPSTFPASPGTSYEQQSSQYCSNPPARPTRGQYNGVAEV